MVRGQRLSGHAVDLENPVAVFLLSAVRGRTIWLEPRSAVTIFTKSAVPRSRGHEISPEALVYNCEGECKPYLQENACRKPNPDDPLQDKAT